MKFEGNSSNSDTIDIHVFTIDWIRPRKVDLFFNEKFDNSTISCSDNEDVKWMNLGLLGVPKLISSFISTRNGDMS